MCIETPARGMGCGSDGDATGVTDLLRFALPREHVALELGDVTHPASRCSASRCSASRALGIMVLQRAHPRGVQLALLPSPNPARPKRRAPLAPAKAGAGDPILGGDAETTMTALALSVAPSETTHARCALDGDDADGSRALGCDADRSDGARLGGSGPVSPRARVGQNSDGV